MNWKYFIAISFLICNIKSYAQNDSIATVNNKETELENIIIIAPNNLSLQTYKPLGTIDEYLQKASHINMIRRGGYAWEPHLNGMSSERNIATIDGMRIYAACTDKMDPISSYVEISNLNNIKIQNGGDHTNGATIAGSIDFEQKKGIFSDKKLQGNILTGFESNNQQKIIGAGLSYSSPKYYSIINSTFRKAANYQAGGNEEVLYSQFQKLNIAFNNGYLINKHKKIETTFIYDDARNVGYPALPMDVLVAKAFIGSVAYSQHFQSEKVQHWETKLYYNNITHIMDDTKRPIVPIRMDMPGWSNTIGFYSKLNGNIEKHSWTSQISGHQNNSLAEMTMYSNNPNEKDMFMLTWPGVQTSYLDFFLKDKIQLNKHWEFNVSAGLAMQNNIVTDTFGLASIRIFYPEMQRSINRILKKAAASIIHQKNNWSHEFSIQYGERAPTVSEGYGFYLFNSFDRFDYIGNPNMKHEKSYSSNLLIKKNSEHLVIKFSGNYFYILDYMIGKPDSNLSVMTIGASGVKVYEQLANAQIWNLALDIHYLINQNFTWQNFVSYRNGWSNDIGHLPLMQPLMYNTNIQYKYNSFNASFGVQSNAEQNKINPLFGETFVPAFTIINFGMSYKFNFGQQSLYCTTGVDNILDKKYTTFSDWNRIPRMGRNFYLNIVYSF